MDFQINTFNPLFFSPKLRYLVKLEHSGEDCWSKCKGQEGKCDWCGTEGWCCKKSSIGNGCDGSFGGESGHRCVLKPN